MTTDQNTPGPEDPVPFDDLVLPSDDGLRRSVRRAIGRTAIDAAALAVIILVGGFLLSVFVVQPLVIGRGERAAVAARAAYEAPMIFNPGVEVTDYQLGSGVVDRTVTVEAVVRLGSGVDDPTTISSRIGAFRIDVEWRAGVNERPVSMQEVLPGIDDGTVVTVHIGTPSPLTIAEAQSLADDPGRDVRLTWVGFDVHSSMFGAVGYPLCKSDPHLSDDFFSASSAGFSGWSTGTTPSVQRALESVSQALELIASQDEVSDAMTGRDPGALRSLADAMQGERSVTSIVVTGPTPEVVAFLDDLGVTDGQMLAVGFYSWGSPVCGR
ncbi:MAG: hypothetical protein ACLGHX_04400 [Acidimicrobiia bacterium]